MNFLKSIKNLLTTLSLSLKRFPLTILISASTAAMLIAISEIRPLENTLNRITMVLALGIPLSLSIKVFFEKRNEKNIPKLLIVYGASVLLLVLYYYFFLTDIGMVSTSRYIAVSLALYLIFLFLPYLPNDDNFELYIIAVVTSFFSTVIYSIVLYAGLSAILFTIDKLLNIQVLSKVYYYTWLFVVFIFAVSYFLSGIPTKNKDLTVKSYPKLLRILILYIIIPLLTAYTFILYIYFAKIIITMQWPIGLVSHLVLWYSIIVIAVLFFITPILKEGNWIYRFFKFAPKVLLPLIFMMFISIGKRINAYGVTEARYYVVILALWSFCIMLYFSFNRKLKNIVILVSLSIVALFSCFGPLSSYSVSKYSQNERLKGILTRNDMLKDGYIESSNEVSKEDRVNISSILDYFNRIHNLKDVKFLPQDFKLEDMNKVFGFSYEYPDYKNNNGYFYFSRSMSEKAIDISGYDYLFDMRSLMNGTYTSNNDLNASYNYETANIKISYAGNEIYTKDLNSFVKELINRHGYQSGENTISSDEMTLIEENNKIKVKFVFQSISGNKNQSNENVNNKGFEFYLMIKIK